MRIKTKLAIEVIVLIALIGTVSLFSITNTRQLQQSFDELNTDTMPALENLRDMRLAITLVTSSTMEIMLVENEAKDATGEELRELEEELEFELFEIENAKALFDQAINEYAIYLENNLPGGLLHKDTIAAEWNRLVTSSNTMIVLHDTGARPDEILVAKDEFEDAQQAVNREIFSAITFTTSSVNTRQQAVEETIEETIISILITLNVFIIAALGIRFFILRSISNPLVKLRKTASEIAQGKFVKTKIKSSDEIGELAHDIDKMSTDLEKLNKDIVAAERLSSIGSLASRLAHDLRNPLSVIKNSLEILNMKLSQYMDEKVDHQLAMMGRAINRMSHQIEDVLDFVNVAELKVESSSVITLVESAILSTDIPQSVKVNVPKNSATIRCDPYRVEVVMSNILKNASQAVEGNGEISIRIIDQKEEVLIEIEDSGPGIPESVLPKIFEPLYTTKQTGTGLGLASCMSIIEKHGGTILARNNPTVFTIQLPKDPSESASPKKVQEKKVLHE